MTHDPIGEQGSIINIRGMRVGLGPRDPSVLDAMTRWINIFQTRRTLSDPRPHHPGRGGNVALTVTGNR